jgi:SAM-dependent methyltransferase
VRERTHRNFDGGDAGHQWDHGLVVRHAVNYAVAVRECAGTAIPGPMIDVGAGAGGFSVWAAHAMRRRLVIVDQDPGHRELAARAFPDVEVHASTGGLERAPVVLAMEVIEHVQPHEQAAFVREVAALVHPGGTLVLSTPDESGYWGGWSGYPPHVGCLDATELSRMLTTQLSGWDIDVLRLEGPGFELSRLGKYGVPVANRVWGKLDGRAPRLTHELAYRLNQLGKQRKGPPAPEPGVFRVGPARQGAGTGLVARAVRPA